MITRKNKYVSMLLAVVMVMTMVFGIIPPIEVHAADGGTGGLKISSPSDGATINGFETIKVKWNRYTGADHYLLVVKDETTGQKVFEEEVSYSTSSTRTYNIYSDDYVFTEDGHEYKIYVVAMDEYDDELNNGAAWHAIYVDNELELETPELSYGYSVTHCADDDLYISWDEIDGADDYSVYIKRLNGYPDFGNDNETGTNISYDWEDDCEISVPASKLIAGKWYKVAICAENTDQGITSDWDISYILMEESSYLEVSEYPDDLDAEKGSTGSFWINSNLDWDISCDVSWLTWTINQVDDTHAEIIVKATSANTKTYDREAEFTISADGVDDEYVYVTQLAPEIELPSFSNVKISGNVSLGEKITWSANVNGNGSLLETVSVGIYSKQLDDSVYFRNVNIDEETYSLSGSVSTGVIVSGYDASGNAKKLDMSLAGEYTVTLHASTDAAFNNYAATNPVTITLTESVGTGILGDVNSDGQVTNLDRFILNRYLNSMSGYTANMVNKESADIDGDGNLTEDDSTILARHLFGWIGYEDLSAFYIGPTTPPVTDTSKWNVNFSNNTVRIEVTKVSGEIDSNKRYLFVAEDTAGLHYIGYIEAGKTSASFSIKDLQMSRGETYSYYVLPEGIVLANNKDKYFISECAVPLYNGMMITSVKNDGHKVYTGGELYADSDIIINWDGSYGVNNFTLNVLVNGNSVYKTTYNHDGPGTTTIDSSVLSVGDVKIIGTVNAPTGSGLSNATSTWTGKIINRPSEAVDTTGYIDELNDLFMNYDTNFETLVECAKDEFDAYYSNEFSTYASTVVADIVNLSDVVDILTNGDPDVTYAKRAIGRLIETMDDEYYGGIASECIDVTAALINYFENSELGAIKSMFEGTHHLNAILAVKSDLDARRLDNINNQLSLYIEKLFEYGFEEDIIMEKYAEIYSYQTANMSKSSALKKVSKVAGAFGKGLGALIDCMDKLDVFLKVKSIVWDPFFVDYSVDIVKLDIIIAALEDCGWEKISTAANRLKLEMENQLAKAAANAIIVGTDMFVEGLTGGAWAIVSAPLSLTIADTAESVRDFGYICEIEYALYSHINSLAHEYLEDADSHYLMQIKKDLHALSDCRALMNSMAISINKITILIFEVWRDDITTTLETYRYYYAHRHTAIEELFG